MEVQWIPSSKITPNHIQMKLQPSYHSWTSFATHIYHSNIHVRCSNARHSITHHTAHNTTNPAFFHVILWTGEYMIQKAYLIAFLNDAKTSTETKVSIALIEVQGLHHSFSIKRVRQCRVVDGFALLAIFVHGHNSQWATGAAITSDGVRET